ncbi:MICAL C-terminal-like protein [Iris pallida]|uniref:MICAL C-terminal-like protein n=1 Tax=Iris pallida TaxID=29817 RepID=A0AAX6DVY9_IRIPA|nr:MICAL C-terminal-like protein [Iris pallida]KAJ6805673.1 MICAL C-terminal-like protein [Iris pallida]
MRDQPRHSRGWWKSTAARASPRVGQRSGVAAGLDGARTEQIVGGGTECFGQIWFGKVLGGLRRTRAEGPCGHDAGGRSQHRRTLRRRWRRRSASDPGGSLRNSATRIWATSRNWGRE